jgi:hypothetical protein
MTEDITNENKDQTFGRKDKFWSYRLPCESRVYIWKCTAHSQHRTFTCEIIISPISSSTKPVFPAGRRKSFVAAV